MTLPAVLKPFLDRGWTRMFCVVSFMLAAGGCFENHPPQRGASLLDDHVINARVESALHANADDHLDQVRAASTNAVVTLSGTVSSPDQKQKAASLTGRVDQVRGVQNEIVVGKK
jgi:BON domain